MAFELVYKDILIDTNYDNELAEEIIDELLKRRLFITTAKETTDPDSHKPLFFHIGFKGHRVSIRISRDIEKRWCCSVFSVKAFSKQQPPVFIVQ